MLQPPAPHLLAVAVLQTLLNMAMMPEVAQQLEEAGAPNYIHGMNLARVRIAHDSTLPPVPSLTALSSHITAQLMRIPEEPAAQAKGGSKAGRK
jgi:hypothetical protein